MMAVRQNSRRPPFAIGIDIFKPSLQVCRRRKSHDNVILADVRHLPLRPRSVDAALCSQVIEHVSKEEGIRLIEELDRVARIRTIIALPVGFVPYLPLDPTDSDRNPFNAHKAGWIPIEIEKLGFRVVGQGLRGVYEEGGLARKVPKLLRPLAYLASFMVEPILYVRPSLAIYMIGTREPEATLTNKELS